jgi:hypothetical protein
MKARGSGIPRRSQKNSHRCGTDNIHLPLAHSTGDDIDQTVLLTDGYTQTAYVIDGRHVMQAISIS